MDADVVLVGDAIRAIGRCAQIVPEAAERCCASLMGFMKSHHGAY